MSKYYFKDKDSEICYPKKTFINEMKESGISKIKIFKAVPIKSSDAEYIFCIAAVASGDKGNCGNLCANYQPRNGKSGMCKHQGRLYEIGEEVIIKIK